MANDPTVQQLRAFQAVAEELHFGRAARRLHTTQPPLTRHIQALERVLGVRLLNRTSRRVELTAAGEVLHAENTVVLGRLDRAMELTRRSSGGQAHRLVLGYLEPMAIDLLPRALRAFRQLHANVDLRLSEMHTNEQIGALHAGKIDCGLVRAPANDDPALSFERVWVDELVAVLPEGHRLLREDPDDIDLADLAGEPFLVFEPYIGRGLLAAMLSGCAAAGFTPIVTRQAQSTPMLVTWVAAGEGVAMVSGENARVPRPGVAFVRLRGAPARSEVLLGWRRGEVSQVREDLRHLLRRTADNDARHGIGGRENGIGTASADG